MCLMLPIGPKKYDGKINFFLSEYEKGVDAVYLPITQQST